MRFEFVPSTAVDPPGPIPEVRSVRDAWFTQRQNYYVSVATYSGMFDIYNDDDKRVFTASFRPNTCCGILELKSFQFWRDTPQKEFSKVFQEGLKHVGETLKKAFVHLTLMKYVGTNQWAQYQYFVRTLEEYPGAIHSASRVNPNSRNTLQFWVLPI